MRVLSLDPKLVLTTSQCNLYYVSNVAPNYNDCSLYHLGGEIALYELEVDKSSE